MDYNKRKPFRRRTSTRSCSRMDLILNFNSILICTTVIFLPYSSSVCSSSVGGEEYLRRMGRMVPVEAVQIVEVSRRERDMEKGRNGADGEVFFGTLSFYRFFTSFLNYLFILSILFGETLSLRVLLLLLADVTSSYIRYLKSYSATLNNFSEQEQELNA